MEFYKNVGKSVLFFNLISIFFLILTIFAYSIIQYMFQPLIGISNRLFDDPAVIDSLMRVLDLILVLPQMLDYAFLLLLAVLIFDLIYISWKTDTGSLFNTMAFTLIGLPVWVYLMQKITEFKDWALEFIGSVIVYNNNLTLYSYVQQNSLEISIYLFMAVIAIRTIPWGNIKQFSSKLVPKKDQPEQEKSVEEIFKQ